MQTGVSPWWTSRGRWDGSGIDASIKGGGAEPVHWILLTTHGIDSVAAAWQIVDWYRQRWIIEQFFRTLKLQGLRIEDSQLTTADRLLNLVAIAAKAAAIIMQLVQARDGRSGGTAAPANQS